MWQFLLLTVMVFAVNLGFSVYQAGQSIPNICWMDYQDQKKCLEDYKGHVRVLFINAGWCGPCNSHMSEMSSAVNQFQGKPVTFFSVSIDGWSQGQDADAQFLRQWRQQHNIPFEVVAGVGDELKKFFNPPYYIPADVVIDRLGKLTIAKQGISQTELFTKIKQLMDVAPFPLVWPPEEE